MNKTVVFFVTLVFTSCATLTHKYPSKKIRHVKFENTQRNTDFQFYYPSVKNDTILQELLVDYSLQKLVENTKSEQEKVLVILNWVRQQWEHNGYNDAKTNNPIEILQRVKKGEQFRCVEYGIVLQNCLSAIGLPSRTLGLQTRDVEITKYGAGHVLSEVWLNDYQKWAMVDAQFNAMPMLNDVPLNVVELQDAIISKKNFQNRQV